MPRVPGLRGDHGAHAPGGRPGRAGSRRDGYWLDSPPEGGRLVLRGARRGLGRTLYALLLPFRNATAAAVAVAVRRRGGCDRRRVTGIRAAVSTDGLGAEVSFRSSDPRRDLLLFWGPRPWPRPRICWAPHRGMHIDAGQARFTVPVLAGVKYWFAVLDAEAWKLGHAPLVRAANGGTLPASGRPRDHELRHVAPTSRRGTPLPSLTLERGVQTGMALDGLPRWPFPGAAAVSGHGAGDRILKSGLPPLTRAARAAGPPRGSHARAGGQKGLQAIVKGPFLGGDLDVARRAAGTSSA